MKTDEIAVCQMSICTLPRFCLRACGPCRLRVVHVGGVMFKTVCGFPAQMFSHFIKTM